MAHFFIAGLGGGPAQPIEIALRVATFGDVRVPRVVPVASSYWSNHFYVSSTEWMFGFYWISQTSDAPACCNGISG